MSNIKNTKGQANMIAIALMIIMVTVSVAIIYSSLKDTIESPFFSPEGFPSTIKKQSILIDAPCYDPLTNSLEITLTKNNKEPLKSLTFKLNFDDESKYWKCGLGCGDCKILDQGRKTYYFFPGKAPKTIEIIEDERTLILEEVTLCQ